MWRKAALNIDTNVPQESTNDYRSGFTSLPTTPTNFVDVNAINTHHLISNTWNSIDASNIDEANAHNDVTPSLKELQNGSRYLGEPIKILDFATFDEEGKILEVGHPENLIHTPRSNSNTKNEDEWEYPITTDRPLTNPSTPTSASSIRTCRNCDQELFPTQKYFCVAHERNPTLESQVTHDSVLFPAVESRVQTENGGFVTLKEHTQVTPRGTNQVTTYISTDRNPTNNSVHISDSFEYDQRDSQLFGKDSARKCKDCGNALDYNDNIFCKFDLVKHVVSADPLNGRIIPSTKPIHNIGIIHTPTPMNIRLV